MWFSCFVNSYRCPNGTVGKWECHSAAGLFLLSSLFLFLVHKQLKIWPFQYLMSAEKGWVPKDTTESQCLASSGLAPSPSTTFTFFFFSVSSQKRAWQGGRPAILSTPTMQVHRSCSKIGWRHPAHPEAAHTILRMFPSAYFSEAKSLAVIFSAN